MSSPDGLQLAAQPLPPMEMPKASPLDSLFNRRPGSGINLPFQFVIHNQTGAAKYISQSITSFTGVSSLIAHGRLCTLEELEVVVAPSFLATKYPVTSDICWTANDVIPNANNILNYPSATRITVGGPLAFGPSLLKCPFGYINNVIKAPLAFTDFPRISISCMEQPTAASEAKDSVLASILIRGVVHVSHPASTLSLSSTVS